MNFEVSKENDIAVVEVKVNRATMTEAGEFKSILSGLLDEGYTKMVVDLSDCGFIDSAFLGTLVVFLKKVTPMDGDIKLVGFQPAVNAMFELTRMHRIFEAFENVNEAKNSFN